LDWVTAASIIAEIGTDMDVFASARHLAAWAGFAPGDYESAGKPKGAGTRRGNVFLKSALFAAASAAVRTKGSYYRDKYNRLRARRGPVRAIMAVAHKLLIAAFHMLSTGEAFRDLGEGLPRPGRTQALHVQAGPTPEQPGLRCHARPEGGVDRQPVRPGLFP